MPTSWTRVIREFIHRVLPPPEGPAGIARLGHRGYVGGMWDEMGRIQFEFLRSRGLRPSSYLMDVACGSLRLGVHAIPFLDPGHYLGIEKEESLVKAGLEVELDPAVRAERRPVIVISSSFEFHRFGRQTDFAIAQSLFTHLPTEAVPLCLRRIAPALADDGVFFASFFRSESAVRNPRRSHDHLAFRYTEREMLSFGEAEGLRSRYIGDWGHPRGQVMVEYRRSGAA